MKKLLALVLVCLFTMNFVAFEAVGKTRSVKRSFSPPPQQSTVKKSPTQQMDQSKTMKKPSTTQQQQQANSRPGSNLLRNVGLLAGGMMLGGLLASLFGGSEMLANIFGMLFNVIGIMLVVCLFLVAFRFLWKKIRGDQHSNNRNQSNKYR